MTIGYKPNNQSNVAGSVTDDPDDVAATGATTDPSAFGLETG